MFGNIAQFLLDIVFTLFGAALILRAWMHAMRLHPLNPVAQTVLQVTNWLVTPLRKILPSTGATDWASLLATWLTAVVYLLLTQLLAIGILTTPIERLPTIAVGALVMSGRWALNLAVWITLIQAILSWVNPMAPIMAVLGVLTAPLLNPIRAILPRTPIDFSPLILLVIAQVLLMLLMQIYYRIMLM